MSDILAALAEGILWTIAVTAASFGLGAVLGLPLTLLRRSALPILWLPAATIVEVLRAIPPIVWLFIVYYAIGSDLVRLSSFGAAVVGLGLISAAHLSEVYRAGLESVPRGQWEAGRALAVPTIVLYQRVVAPQAVALVVPPAATYGIGLLKDSAVASVIGVTDIAFFANQQTQADLNGLGNFGIAALLYILLSLPVAAASRYTGRRLEQKVGIA